MTKIVEQTPQRLVVENRPKVVFGTLVVMGVLGIGSAVQSIVTDGSSHLGEALFQLALGIAFVAGSLVLYRGTRTAFDKRSGTIDWRQRGLIVDKTRTAGLDEIRKIVVGKPVGHEGGSATAIRVVFDDDSWPLAFGFSGLYPNERTAETIRNYLSL